MLNTAFRYNKIETNPVKDASMPKLSNVRMLTISHEDYLHLLECSEEHIEPVLIMAYYEPMRKDEINGIIQDIHNLVHLFNGYGESRS